MKSFHLVLLGLLTGILAGGGGGMNIEAAPPKYLSVESRLTVTAQFYEGPEDERAYPVSAGFYLFKRSFVDILKSRNFQPVVDRDRIIADESAYLEAFAELFFQDDEMFGTDEETDLLRLLLEDAVAANRIARIRTDESGRSAAINVPPGNYHLFGSATFEGEIFIWDVPVRVAEGAQTLEVNQYNADAVVSDRRRFFPAPYFNPDN